MLPDQPSRSKCFFVNTTGDYHGDHGERQNCQTNSETRMLVGEEDNYVWMLPRQTTRSSGWGSSRVRATTLFSLTTLTSLHRASIRSSDTKRKQCSHSRIRIRSRAAPKAAQAEVLHRSGALTDSRCIAVGA